jgi:phosphohistidine phosphatase
MPTSPAPSARHLWVLRHGKAASDAPWGGSDGERPLTARGRRDATALGAALTEDPPLGITGVPAPQRAVCSSAVRTRQTARLVVEAMGGRVPIESLRALYAADVDTLLGHVREIDDGAQSALLIGHNPGVLELVYELVALAGDSRSNPDGSGEDQPDTAEQRLEAHGFPTCALAVVALDVGDWAAAGPGCGRLLGLFKPPY